MDLSKVIFLSTNVGRSAAVQIRCVDIARHLGCDYKLGIRSVEEILDRYSIFVCIKANLPAMELRRLAQDHEVALNCPAIKQMVSHAVRLLIRGTCQAC